MYSNLLICPYAFFLTLIHFLIQYVLCSPSLSLSVCLSLSLPLLAGLLGARRWLLTIFLFCQGRSLLVKLSSFSLSSVAVLSIFHIPFFHSRSLTLIHLDALAFCKMDKPTTLHHLSLSHSLSLSLRHLSLSLSLCILHFLFVFIYLFTPPHFAYCDK